MFTYKKSTLYLDHQAYLKRKKLYKLEKGRCVYIVHAGDENNQKLKIGKSTDITDRVSGFRTINPHCKLLFVMYTNENDSIENTMKKVGTQRKS